MKQCIFFTMSRLERNRCLVIMNDYYRLHLPDFPVLKSLDVLKELFFVKSFLSGCVHVYACKHSASCVFFSPLFLPTFVASL